MVDLANTVWRDFSTAGIPSSGKKKPEKSKIREWGTYLESLTAAAGYGNTVWFATKALLTADLAHAAGIPAIVYADTTAANNGIYIKSGASGLGSWGQIITYLPGYQFVTATDAGAGTANAIVATSSPRVAYTDGVQLVRLNIFETNTSTAVTVAFDGGAALTIQTAAGNAPAIGGLAAGMTVLGVVDQSASVFRLLSDQTSAAVLSGAEDALADLLLRYLGPYVDDAAANVAAGTPSVGQIYWNTTSDILKVWNGSGWIGFSVAVGTISIFNGTGDGATTDFVLDASATSTNTFIVAVGGVLQVPYDVSAAPDGYTIASNTLTFSAAPPTGAAIYALTYDTAPIGQTTAALTTVSDSGAYFTGNNVETVLQEVGASLLTSGGHTLPAAYGAVGDGVTDDTTALQAMFDDLSGGEIVVLGGKTYKVTTVNIPVSCTVMNGAITSALATAGSVVTIASAARPTLKNVTVTGGGSKSTYVGLNYVVSQIGASVASRAAGFILDNCTISGAGDTGIYGEFNSSPIIRNCSVSNCCYAGIQILSPVGTRIRDSYVNMLGAVGASSNAYGITLSYDSTDYDLDQTVNPFPTDSIVDGNTIEGPEIWEALDHHGAYGCSYTNNHIYASKYGIMFSAGSGDATAYAGYQNICSGNIIDCKRKRDRSASGVTPVYGIACAGGVTVNHEDFIIANNIIYGFGNTVPDTGSVSIHLNVYWRWAVVTGNILENWVGYGIVISLASGEGVISNNVFGAASGSPTGGACIFMDDFTGRLMMSGNVARGGSFPPARGLSVGSGCTGAAITYASDFRGATTEISNSAGSALRVANYT